MPSRDAESRPADTGRLRAQHGLFLTLRTGLWTLTVALLLLSAGCGREAPAVPAPQPAVSIRPIDLEGYHQVLQSHRGRFVMVDFWATWCAPCRMSFPDFVRMHKDLGGRGLAVVSISVDDPSQKDGPVRKFLQSQGADFETLILDVEVIDDFMAAVSESWTGEIPAVFLYDREGSLIQSFRGPGASDEAERAVRALLTEEAPEPAQG